MFIDKITVRNFRPFSDQDPPFTMHLNVPNGTEGSGLTAIVGENGCGKSSLLDAIALPLVAYKAEAVSIDDFNNEAEGMQVLIDSQSPFTVRGTMPKAEFQATGFEFKANLRARNTKAYLSSLVVSDQLYVPKDPTKPKAGSPDLRMSVNNPYVGSRFSENEVLLLGEKSTYQTRRGTFNSTRFDRLMEDFDFQYFGGSGFPADLNSRLGDVLASADNTFLQEAIDRFETCSGYRLALNLTNNVRPFQGAFFAMAKEGCRQIPLNQLGSGYEMMFALLLGASLSKQAGKQLICLVDEPELHLHPAAQESFVAFLIELSKDNQVIIASHSPLLVKQLMRRNGVAVQVLYSDGSARIRRISERVLPYVSSNEVNFLAFGLPTVEYHNELYGELEEKYREVNPRANQAEVDKFLQENLEEPTLCKWTAVKQGREQPTQTVTLQTYIRNLIHHPENTEMRRIGSTVQQLQNSIVGMIGLLRKLKSEPNVQTQI